MKNYKSLIVGSLLAAMIVISPLAVFAQEQNESRDNQPYQVKEKKMKEKNARSNSIWNRVTRFFNEKSRSALINKKPVISGITAPTVLKTGEVGTWTINASDPQNGTLSYSVNWGDASSISPLAATMQPSFVQTGTFTHSYANPGTYKITFTVSNSAGFSTISKVNVRVGTETVPPSTDTTAPTISELSVRVNSSTGVLSWKTSEPATTVVYYSTVSPVDVNASTTKSMSDTSLRSGHSLSISGLASNTLYHFIIKSTDASNNTSTSSEGSFVTTF